MPIFGLEMPTTGIKDVPKELLRPPRFIYASFFPFWSSVGRKRGLQGLGGWTLKDLDGLGPEY